MKVTMILMVLLVSVSARAESGSVDYELGQQTLSGMALISGGRFPAQSGSRCIERYQHRIDQSAEWARLGNRFPSQGERRAEKAQEVINLITQSFEAMDARYPGGEELVKLTYRINRYRRYDDRATVGNVARVIRKMDEERTMCPDYRYLMSTSDIRKHVTKVLFE